MGYDSRSRAAIPLDWLRVCRFIDTPLFDPPSSPIAPTLLPWAGALASVCHGGRTYFRELHSMDKVTIPTAQQFVLLMLLGAMAQAGQLKP